MLPYFNEPHQVLFLDPDANEYLAGIAYRNEVICACCGGVFEISELYEFAPAGSEPIKVYGSWIEFGDSIGVSTDCEEYFENIIKYMPAVEVDVAEENLPF